MTGAQSSSSSLQNHVIAGIHVDNLSEDETLAKIGQLVTQGGAHYMAVVNAAKIVAAQHDEQLFDILNSADIVTADGMSVVWAARWLGQPVKERVTGIDIFARLIEYAAAQGLGIYFLGGREAVVKKLVEILTERFPQLRVAGFHHGYFDAQENAEIVRTIRQSRADLLFVAMGSPAQEKWLAANLQPSGVKFALGVGGSFDHVAGFARRAPRWMQQTGLEWLHRLWLEPRRLWRRYVIGNTRFIGLVIKQKFGGEQGTSKW